MNLLDLFSGIGGFHKGLTSAGFEFDWVGYSEIDKYAESVYAHNFNKVEALGDIRTIQTKGLPKIDICTFGFPCQDLSIAGKRGGIEATRSGLFFEAMRVIRDVKPKYIIFENVKGLLSSGGKRDFTVVLKEVADAGYDGQWQLLNTRWFLPQNRERVYFIGHLRGERRPEVFPLGESHEGCFGTQEALVQVGSLGEKNSMGQRVYSEDGIACSIRSGGGGQGGKTGLYEIKFVVKDHDAIRERDTATCIDANYHKGLDNHGERTGVRVHNQAVEYEVLDDYNDNIRKDGNTPTLTSNCGAKARRNGIKIIADTNVRRLTPRECERLQGFSDDFTKYGLENGEKMEISDSQRYKQLGNAVSVPVVEAIGRRLRE
tara:strand:+ start:24014 stop:25135 length:1122 start_codon:yes stop_codon:yes gene_type:complete